MRRYLFVECKPEALNAIPGCRYVPDSGRNQVELQFDNYHAPEDYPAKVCLLSTVGASHVQLVPLTASDEAVDGLVAALTKAKLTVYADAKALATAKPAVADAHLYPMRPILDGAGKIVGAEKVPGGVLQVACCLAGDDPARVADPAAAKAAEEPPLVGEGRERP